MDYDLNPPWTSFNMAIALNLRLIIITPKHSTIDKGKALLMVNNKVTYQRQSWIPNTPTGMRQSLFLLQVMRIIWHLLSLKSTSSILTCI